MPKVEFDAQDFGRVPVPQFGIAPKSLTGREGPHDVFPRGLFDSFDESRDAVGIVIIFFRSRPEDGGEPPTRAISDGILGAWFVGHAGRCFSSLSAHLSSFWR